MRSDVRLRATSLRPTAPAATIGYGAGPRIAQGCSVLWLCAEIRIIGTVTAILRVATDRGRGGPTRDDLGDYYRLHSPLVGLHAWSLNFCGSLKIAVGQRGSRPSNPLPSTWAVTTTSCAATRHRTEGSRREADTNSFDASAVREATTWRGRDNRSGRGRELNRSRASSPSSTAASEHVLVHTGQNYDYELGNEVFFSATFRIQQARQLSERRRAAPAVRRSERRSLRSMRRSTAPATARCAPRTR